MIGSTAYSTTVKRIQILSYVNCVEDLDVSIVHDHAALARSPLARVRWLDGDVYDKVCDELNAHERVRLEHDGDISIVYSYTNPNPNKRPTDRALARALIKHIEKTAW